MSKSKVERTGSVSNELSSATEHARIQLLSLPKGIQLSKRQLRELDDQNFEARFELKGEVKGGNAPVVLSMEPYQIVRPFAAGDSAARILYELSLTPLPPAFEAWLEGSAPTLVIRSRRKRPARSADLRPQVKLEFEKGAPFKIDKVDRNQVTVLAPEVSDRREGEWTLQATIDDRQVLIPVSGLEGSWDIAKKIREAFPEIRIDVDSCWTLPPAHHLTVHRQSDAPERPVYGDNRFNDY